MNENNSKNYLYIKLIGMCLSVIFPLAVLDTPFWISGLVGLAIFSPVIFGSESLFVAVCALYSLIARPALYIWALVVTIGGPQDTIAILFYILAGIQAFSIIKNFLLFAFAIISGLRK